MKIKFCGAARQVTGSMHLLELASGYKMLVDCGLDYDQKKNFHRDTEVEFPFDPKTIDCVVLTHAHIDHSGNLPTLVKQGFGGKIVCTPPTAELTGYLLMDSLKIMEMESGKRRRGSKHKKRQGSLYSFKDYREAMDRFVTLEFYKRFEVIEGLVISFVEAGHILGAASVLVEVTENDKTTRFGFTGDIGNYGSRLMKDPAVLEDIDYLVSESTYGGRYHKSTGDAGEELLHYITKTCVDQPGRLVIPAFSVGRTQSIIFALNQLYQKGMLPPVKIFIDSPLAIKTTHIYQKYLSYLNDETRAFYKKYESLFEFENTQYLMAKDQSEDLQNYYEPCVIISAAGMVEGGRIQEHIRNNIRNAYCTVLIAGFCAEGTLGHRLLQGQRHVKINGKEFPVYASVAATDAFSAHPDHAGLLRYFENAGMSRLKKIFLVHGEESSMFAIKNALAELDYDNVVVPEKGEEFEII